MAGSLASQSQAGWIIENEAEWANAFVAAMGDFKVKSERSGLRLAVRIRNAAIHNASGAPGPAVDHGELRASIQLEPESGQRDQGGWHVDVGTSVRYGLPLEFGWMQGGKHHGPYPFMRPAIAEAIGVGLEVE